MAVLLKDIPDAPLTPDEVEALANDEFDYADREQVSMREARRKIRRDLDDKINTVNLLEINRIFGTHHELPATDFSFGDLMEGPGNFTVKEKAIEFGKALHRGAGNVIKIPGIALKAIGEGELTRKEIEELRQSPDPAKQRKARFYASPAGKRQKAANDMLRRAGNAYIERINGLMMDESPESRVAREQSFWSDPFYRTGVAVSESVPSYGLAIAGTLTSGNPNIGLYIIGTTSASSAYENLRQSGVDPDLALLGAVTEGSIEMITEKVPMDMLMKSGGRPFLVRALRLGTAESFQELFAQLGQNYVDAVVKDIDPENRATVVQAARQEWGIITQGWEDAMAAGFVMGGGAAAFAPIPDLGRTQQEMREAYGFTPRNDGEFIALVEKIREQVREVREPFEGVVEAAAEAGDTGRVTATLKELQAESEAQKKLADAIPLSPAERKQFPGIAQQEDQIASLQELQAVEHATVETVTEQAVPDITTEPLTKTQQRNADAIIAHPEADVVPGTNRVRMTNDKGVVFQISADQIDKKLKQGWTVTEDIGEGEVKKRGTSLSVLAQAIEDELVDRNRAEEDDIPVYRSMNMKVQSEKVAAIIDDDLERAKRIAFYQEVPPAGVFPENVFTGLRVYGRDKLDIDLLMGLALKEDVVREHTILGKRIKSLDTDQDFADPVRAIREVVDARKDELARKGKDISALEIKLQELQDELDRTKKAVGNHIKKAVREYGKKNTLVSRTEYDTIIARRKKESAEMKHGRSLGAAYVPNAQDFADIAKIAAFHLEALGRDFAKWSQQMTKDFGTWITPHLQDEFDKAVAQAEAEGVTIKEGKRLTAKKKRLATLTKKIEGRLSDKDLAKVPRLPIELDSEGQRLQNEYDVARESLKAAQAAASIITEEEVRIIAQLAKDVATRKEIMEGSKRRDTSIGESATDEEYAYGIAMSLFLEYVNDLKVKANKRTSKEVIKNYLANPVDFVSDFAGTLKAAKASLDNSFHLRQGLPTFLKGVTGDVESAKIWWATFVRSWQVMWQTLGKTPVMRGLFAEMVSDPDYKLLKKSGIAINVIEEEIPVDIPSRTPLVGMLFRMGENAFVASGRYMRYRLAKQYFNIWRKSGRVLDKKELESIGKLANSQTGRGDSAAKSQKPGLLNNLFWSPRNLRAYIDILTLHAFDRNFSAFARYQAAKNLIRYISGAAIILAIADWIDDDSVTADANSADFGKIRIGNTRFSIGGGAAVLIVLASRLATRKFTSTTTGITRKIDSGRFGALGGKDLIWNFVENKFSPAAQLVVSIIDQKTWDGNQLIIPQMVDDALTPLIIQNVIETGSVDDSANVLAALMAEALGVNVQTYTGIGAQKPKKRKQF